MSQINNTVQQSDNESEEKFYEAIFISDYGKIRDPLHDTIPISEAEKRIIDTFEFQRLRRIHQTAFMRYVFPGATHTRFEHSLGAMHLSGLFLSRLIENQTRIVTEYEKAIVTIPSPLRQGYLLSEEIHGSVKETRAALQILKRPYTVQCLRFAALLHDIGHAPFSHSSERFMPTWSEFERYLKTDAVAAQIPQYLRDCFEKKLAKHRTKPSVMVTKKIRHEIYSLIIASRVLSSFADFPRTLAQDVCAILDADVAPEPSSFSAQVGIVSLLHEIVSGEIDIDRMDYLLRDSRECGVVYGLFDVGRIMDSAAFYFRAETKTFHLAIKKSGVPAFEDFLRARWSMYSQVYFHKTSTACEAMLEQIKKSIPEYTLPLSIDDYLLLDDYSFPHLLVTDLLIALPWAQSLAKDLFYNRRLWKRLYEENALKNQVGQLPSLCPIIVKQLNLLGISSEVVESSTSLTRFSPKGRGRSSVNYLRVIVKDIHGMRILEPIENLSGLVNKVDEDTLLRRLFVAPKSLQGEWVNLKELQKSIAINDVKYDNLS